jgi:hypothetical protein
VFCFILNGSDDDLEWGRVNVQEELSKACQIVVTDHREYCKNILRSEFHPFLAHVYRKDCRTWLWKNEAGTRARLEMASVGILPRSPDPVHPQEESVEEDEVEIIVVQDQNENFQYVQMEDPADALILQLPNGDRGHAEEDNSNDADPRLFALNLDNNNEDNNGYKNDDDGDVEIEEDGAFGVVRLLDL